MVKRRLMWLFAWAAGATMGLVIVLPCAAQTGGPRVMPHYSPPMVTPAMTGGPRVMPTYSPYPAAPGFPAAPRTGGFGGGGFLGPTYPPYPAAPGFPAAPRTGGFGGGGGFLGGAGGNYGGFGAGDVVGPMFPRDKAGVQGGWGRVVEMPGDILDFKARDRTEILKLQSDGTFGYSEIELIKKSPRTNWLKSGSWEYDPNTGKVTIKIKAEYEYAPEEQEGLRQTYEYKEGDRKGPRKDTFEFHPYDSQGLWAKDGLPFSPINKTEN